MSINIKNPETVRLIRQLAELTGKGQTAVVTEAVRERIGQLNQTAERQSRMERMLAVADKTAPLLRDLDVDGAIYGENGLYDRQTGLPK